MTEIDLHNNCSSAGPASSTNVFYEARIIYDLLHDPHAGCEWTFIGRCGECVSPSTPNLRQTNDSLPRLPKGYALHADTLRWPEVALQNTSSICPSTRTYHVSPDSNHIHCKAQHAPITIFCSTTVGSIIHTLSVCAPS